MKESESINNRRVLLSIARVGEQKFDDEEKEVFSRWLRALANAGVRYLLGGAFAVHAYTGIWRDTKDLDVFLEAQSVKPALEALAAEGFRTEVRQAHWLAKAHHEPYLIDLIFGLGNGQLRVDESWFWNTRSEFIAGVDVQLMGLEELLASKLYVATRDRFDGADVVHLMRSSEGRINWERVRAMLGPHSELLLWQLILFDFVYPGHSSYLPKKLMVEMFEEVRQRWKTPADPNSFRGVLLDQFTFIVDVEDWGYADLRKLDPLVDSNGATLDSG